MGGLGFKPVDSLYQLIKQLITECQTWFAFSENNKYGNENASLVKYSIIAMTTVSS